MFDGLNDDFFLLSAAQQQMEENQRLEDERTRQLTEDLLKQHENGLYVGHTPLEAYTTPVADSMSHLIDPMPHLVNPNSHLVEANLGFDMPNLGIDITSQAIDVNSMPPLVDPLAGLGILSNDQPLGTVSDVLGASKIEYKERQK